MQEAFSSILKFLLANFVFPPPPKKPFLQILKFFSYARNCLSERHIKSSRQYRPRGTSSRPGNTAHAAHQAVPAIPPARHTQSRPGNTARAAHTKSPRQYRPCGTSTFRCACSLLRLTRSPHPPRACLPDCSAVHPHSRKMCSQTKQLSDNQAKPRRTPSRARSSASAYLR